MLEKIQKLLRFDLKLTLSVKISLLETLTVVQT